MSDFEIFLIKFYLEKLNKENNIIFFVRKYYYDNCVVYIEKLLGEKVSKTMGYKTAALNEYIKIFSISDCYENIRGYRATTVFVDSGLGDEFYQKIAMPTAKENCFLIHI